MVNKIRCPGPFKVKEGKPTCVICENPLDTTTPDYKPTDNCCRDCWNKFFEDDSNSEAKSIKLFEKLPDGYYEDGPESLKGKRLY